MLFRSVIDLYPETEFVFYKDEHNVSKLLGIYIPIIRPYVLMRYFKEHPEMSSKAVFYCDSDVVFTDGKFYKSFRDGDVLVMTLSYTDRYSTSRYKSIGHTGIVDKVAQYSIRTIEGNTNEQGMRDSRTTDGVYYKIRPLTKKIHITRWAKYQD